MNQVQSAGVAFMMGSCMFMQFFALEFPRIVGVLVFSIGCGLFIGGGSIAER